MCLSSAIFFAVLVLIVSLIFSSFSCMWLTAVSDLPSYFALGLIVGSCMGVLLQPPRVKTLAMPIAPMISSRSASCSIFASKVFGTNCFLNLCVSIQ